MQLSFTEIGTIKNAQLQLNDLTLIVGDNSIGKTLLLESYAFFQQVITEEIEKEFTEISNFLEGGSYLKKIECSNRNLFLEWLDYSVPGDIFELDIKITKNSDDFIEKKIQSLKNNYITAVKKNILLDENSAFNVNFEDLNSEVSFLPCKVTCVMGESRVRTDIKIKDKVYFFNTINEYDVESEINSVHIYDNISRRIFTILNREYIKHIYSFENFMFFPSERNTYQSNVKQKSAELFKSTYSNDNDKVDLRYSETLFSNNYLEYSELMEFQPEFGIKRDGKLYKILCSAINGVPIYENGTAEKLLVGDKELSKEVFSTKQNRLLPYFMLTSRLNNPYKENRIIIEEPEAHMSIKSMFQIRDIIEAILTTNKVLLTSHSDTFVTLINNMIKIKEINASVYEIIQDDGVDILKKIEPGTFGYKFSFMSQQIQKLNSETRDAFL